MVKKLLCLTGLIGLMLVCVVASAGAAIMVGTSGADAFSGTSVTDNISGADGNDMLMGLGGKDYLHGGDGTDGISGGDGNDDIEAGAGRDLVGGLAGDDSIWDGSKPDPDCFHDCTKGMALAPRAGEVVEYDREDGFCDTGDTDRDHLYGGDGNDSIHACGTGGDGDYVYGDDGSDYIHTVNSVRDTISCGSGGDLVLYDKNVDTLTSDCFGSSDRAVGL